MKDQKNFYITTPIYYVNDAPHIGHAYTSVVCDAMARFKRLDNHLVYFLTGTDEHGQKVQKSAQKSGKTEIEYCDYFSDKFRNLSELLNLSNDDFIRTSQERHKKIATKFWQILEEKGYIYKSIYEGWYALRDEAFYAESELIEGRAPTGAEVTWHKEESYFFKLSLFQDKLLALYDAVPDFIQPKSRFNEVISFVRGGREYVKGALKDLSISRTSFDWGIKIANDQDHVMYVWLDALTNYISALGFGEENNELYQKFWLNTNDSPVHVVGKDILRFHGCYWPAFLMAANLPLPNKIIAHGWWTNEGQKISKSLGNTIDPITEIEWLESFGINKNQATDYFRYFLLKEVPFGSDGDYSRKNLIARINAELANNIGNLVQRVLSMIAKNNDYLIVDFSNFDAASDLLNSSYNLASELRSEMEKFAFDLAINKIILLASKANLFIDNQAPWILKKEGKISEMNLTLSALAETIRCIALALESFIPSLSSKVLDLLNIKNQDRNLEAISKSYCLKSGHKINQPEIIFPRIENK
jgi:methionyl-tRNA synthetase